jgi:translation initiation factor 2B subunit (eIF-2B alpha/beta/delta family)
VEFFKQLRESFNLENIKGQVTSARKTAQVIESLLSLLQDNKISSSVREMITNLKTLIIDQPNIVTINHYINHFLLKLNPENQPIVLKELLEVFQERWKNVDRKTAEVAFRLHDYHEKSLLFFGADKSMTALVDSCMVNHKQLKVIQVLGRKDEAGKEQALELQEKAVPLTVVDLYNVARFFQQVDYVFLTADIVMHETFMTKSGGHLLASWAKSHQIPVLVMGDTRKILNKKILPSSVLGSFINEAKKSPSEIWAEIPQEIDGVVYLLEEAPNELVSHFVFEQNAYTPQDLSREVDKILVSKFI